MSSSASASDVAAVIDAMNKLKGDSLSGKKAELQAIIAKYAGIDSSKYTPDSARIFDNALKDAQLAVSKSASSFDLNNAIHVLQSAYEGLIERTDEPA